MPCPSRPYAGAAKGGDGVTHALQGRALSYGSRRADERKHLRLHDPTAVAKGGRKGQISAERPRSLQEPPEEHPLRRFAAHLGNRVDEWNLLRAHLDAILRLAAAF